MGKIILSLTLFLLTSCTIADNARETTKMNNNEVYIAYQNMIERQVAEIKQKNEIEKNKNKSIKKNKDDEKVVVKTKTVKSTTEKIVDNKNTYNKDMKVEAKQIKSSGWETYNVSAYTANYESTQKRPSDPDYGVTANGEKVKENYTLACPKSIPFGTKIYIEYFDNTFTCTDRGGAIKDGRLDVYMKSLDKALDFGRRDLKVKIIK